MPVFFDHNGVVLDLPEDPGVLFRDAFTNQNRNKIRKAEKLGVTVRRGSDAATLGHYADLYAASAQRWQLASPLPRGFFLALAAAPAGVEVWLAEQDGTPLAALLNLNCGGQIMNWGNVSRREAWGTSPNNLRHWRALDGRTQRILHEADLPFDPRQPIDVLTRIEFEVMGLLGRTGRPRAPRALGGEALGWLLVVKDATLRLTMEKMLLKHSKLS